MREGFKNNEKFRSLIENSSEGIIALDTEWQIVYLNATAGKILNRQPADLIDRNIWEAFPGSIGGKFHKAYFEAMDSQETRVVEDYSSVLDRWTKATILPSSKGLIVYFHDITAERQASIRARKTEENFQLFLDRVSDGFIVLDNAFRYVYVNQKIGDLVHRDPKSLIGRNVWEEFPDAVNSLTYKAFTTAFKEQRFISNIDYYEPLQLWQENYIYPSPEGLSIFIKDISERKKLEKELRQKEIDQQFELMIATLEAQEKERTSIAQELHDNVNQLLVASKLMLSLMRDDPQKISAAGLGNCVSNLEKAIIENRRLSHELLTPDLKEQTLADLLKMLLHNMFSPNKIETSVEASAFSETALDNPKKLAVYRIAQEQCTNIIKHANAKKVKITLTSDENTFTMVVADDGMGSSEIKVSQGIGLRNIGGRAGFFGGMVQIDSVPGKGFKLIVTLPTGITIPSHAIFS